MLAALYTACLPEHLQATPAAATALELVDSFTNNAASTLQPLFAGAVAPDAVSVRLSAPALRHTLRLLDVAHVVDILRQSLLASVQAASAASSQAAAAVGSSSNGELEETAAGAWDEQWPLVAELAQEVRPVPHHRRVAARLASHAQEAVAAVMVSPQALCCLARRSKVLEMDPRGCMLRGQVAPDACCWAADHAGRAGRADSG